MFKKFAAFWIENAKLTRLFIGSVFVIGVFSRLIIPKQYNPDIVVPAFQITVPAMGFSSEQTQQLVTKPLENILAGLEGAEHVYGYSANNVSSVLVSFSVGVDKEKATTRLHNAITANRSHVPLGIENWNIVSIDPDDIPVFSFALTKGGNQMKQKKSDEALVTSDIHQTSSNLIAMRKVALDVIEKLKTIPNTTLWYYQGGQAEQVIVDLDLDALASKQIDVMQVFQTLKTQQADFPIGSLKLGDTQASLSIEASQNTLDRIKQIVVASYHERPIYLEDIADIHRGLRDFVPGAFFDDGNDFHDAVFIGVAKKKGKNAVVVTKTLEEKMNQTIKKDLPAGYEIQIIQDEGKVAGETTNMLLINLIQSIIIVFIILTIFLGSKNAWNVAITIPLTLSLVFLFIWITGDNINRITLFALILVLGMLVDNATVVVENINRHLSMRDKTRKKKVEAIFDGIGEVEIGVLLSTLTRLLAFIAMFFVTGMMGDYMAPIPRYAIVTMIVSTFIALSINPFLAYIFEGRKIVKTKDEIVTQQKWFHTIGEKTKKRGDTFGAGYREWMKSYLSSEAKGKRRTFKLFFWGILAVIIIAPIYLGIFRARMLPKSNQQQVYLWLDLPRDANIEKTKEVMREVSNFLKGYYVIKDREESRVEESIGVHQISSDISSDLKIISNTSRWVGIPPMLDFSNLFRGSQSRMMPYQISARINLTHQSERDITSEEFVIQLRPALKKFLREHYPSVDMRLLEDPPGPPVRATFLLKLSSNEITYDTLLRDTQRLQKKLSSYLQKHDVVDVGMSDDGWQTKYIIKLDHQLIANAGITAEQIGATLGILYHGMDIALVYDDASLEPITIQVRGKDNQVNSLESFSQVLITNPQGRRIPLSELAKIIPTENEPVIYSDERISTVYLYGEMGDNSVVYPVLGLYKLFDNPNFWEGKYEYLGGDPYGFNLKHKLTGQELRINIGGERELTMDTFRDMGIAMIIAFLAIYLMMVIQFKSFGIGGVIMISFLLGFFGVFPGYALLYLLQGEYFSATSMIGVIALAGIVVGNAILLVEYVQILLKRGNTVKMALVTAGWTRMIPIIITSLTTIFGATTILGDPVWSGVARAIILGLSSSAVLTTIILPIFLYDGLVKSNKDFDNRMERISSWENKE